MLEERNIDDDKRLLGNSFLNSWIYDKGASNHMTGSIEYLDIVSSIAPCAIKLPDVGLVLRHKGEQ